jgi:hypothetical protein
MLETGHPLRGLTRANLSLLICGPDLRNNSNFILNKLYGCKSPKLVRFWSISLPFFAVSGLGAIHCGQARMYVDHLCLVGRPDARGAVTDRDASARI